MSMHHVFVNKSWEIRNNTLTITKTSKVWRSADNADPLTLRGSLKSLAAHV